MKETINNIKEVYKYSKENKKHLKWLVISCISGIVMGIIVPLLSAKQIVYLTSNTWEQALYISVVILFAQCYIWFAKFFFWQKHAQRFIKGVTKNLQIAIRQRNFKNRTI